MGGDICYYCDGSGYCDVFSGAPCHECGGTGWREEQDDDCCPMCGDYDCAGTCQDEGAS